MVRDLVLYGFAGGEIHYICIKIGKIYFTNLAFSIKVEYFSKL